MKVKATKAMAAEIAKQMKKLGVKFEEISLVKLSERGFALNVGSQYIDDRDWDWEDGTLRVIRVVYPYEFYACPCYLSTLRLEELFNRSNRTLESFMEKIKEEIEC